MLLNDLYLCLLHICFVEGLIFIHFHAQPWKLYLENINKPVFQMWSLSHVKPLFKHCHFPFLEILKGGIIFSSNNHLCNVESILWSDILNMKSQPKIREPEPSSAEHCMSLISLYMYIKLYELILHFEWECSALPPTGKKCDRSCYNGSCWGPSPQNCQKSKCS